MTSAPRHPGPGPVAAVPDLGRELVDFGVLRRATGGQVRVMLFAALVALLLLVLGGFLVMLVLGVLRGDVALIAAGAGVAVVGVLILAPLLALAFGTLRSSLVLHENGLLARQGFRAPLVIPWWEVGEVLPRAHADKFGGFYLRLRTGKLVGIARLRVSHRRPWRDGRVPHPDVTVVLEHYAAWCARHGRPAAIRW